MLICDLQATLVFSCVSCSKSPSANSLNLLKALFSEVDTRFEGIINTGGVVIIIRQK